MSSVPCYHKYTHSNIFSDPIRLEDVYDNIPEIKARFTELNNLFEEKYHCKPDFYVRAPGRVNLIGEHIDYHGLDLSSLLDAKIFRVPHGYYERHDHCSFF